MNGVIEISELRAGDLSATARAHLTAFPDSALTALGEGAVRRYYDWQLHGPHDVAAFAAYCGGELAGFCFGGVFRGAMSGFLRKNRNYLALRVAARPWLAFNPLFRDRLATGLRVLRRFSQPPKPAKPTPDKPRKTSFGILSIAVDPRFQGRGVGKLLMVESEAVARARDFTAMNLSVSVENHQAIRFYEGLGWQKAIRDGVWDGEMTKTLVRQPAV
jgi:ribosomal protein S18 acetylase RimI-like enzyme